MSDQARQLALEIARCPIIAAVLAGAVSPCGEVVNFQKRPAAYRWLAEPWSGHLQKAPIVFLSSNPNSGDPDEPVVLGDLTTSSDNDLILHTFDDAFEEGPWIGVVDGIRLRAADGKIGKVVPYWRSCKARATELLGRPARPGHDYVLTEVVHCGSQHEVGVRPAASECVPRYLDRVMRLSAAKVVVVVGAVARDIVQSMVPDLGRGAKVLGPVDWSGRSRYVLFLPHPNARGVAKGVAAYLDPTSGMELRSIQAHLRTT